MKMIPHETKTEPRDSNTKLMDLELVPLQTENGRSTNGHVKETGAQDNYALQVSPTTEISTANTLSLLNSVPTNEMNGSSRNLRKHYTSSPVSLLLSCVSDNPTKRSSLELSPVSKSKRGLSPVMTSQLHHLRARFKQRTASFRREAIKSPSPDISDDEQPAKISGDDNKERDENKIEPEAVVNNLVISNTEENSRPSCCKPSRGCCSCPKTLSAASHLYLAWLALVTLAYIYNVTSIILRATFTIYYNDYNYMYWLLADYICDVLYLLDMVAVKPRVQFIQNGLVQDDPKLCRRNYYTNSDFKIDLFSLLPLDLFYFMVGIRGSAQPLLRLPRYLKLKCAWEFFDRCDQAAKNGHVIRVLRTMTYMLFLIHVETCGYYAVSVYEGIASNRWVYNGEGIAYIRCFYLATKTATSIGNNPKPTNQLENIFMTIYWLSGVFVFALLIGQIRDIFESANSVKTNYQKAQDYTLQHLQNLNVPEKLLSKVRDWFNYNWEHQKTLNENLLVDVLPTKMKTDLFISVHYDTLSKVSLFQDCEKSLLSDLILKLKPVIFLPGDIICRKGEVGTEMYIIMNGEVEVVTDEGLQLCTLTKGKVFGEISLMSLSGGNRRTANVRAKGYSNVFTLSKHDFERAMEDYPQAYSLLKKRAQKLLKRTPSDNTEELEKVATVINEDERPKTPELLRATVEMANRRGSKIANWFGAKSPTSSFPTNTAASDDTISNTSNLDALVADVHEASDVTESTHHTGNQAVDTTAGGKHVAKGNHIPRDGENADRKLSIVSINEPELENEPEPEDQCDEVSQDLTERDVEAAVNDILQLPVPGTIPIVNVEQELKPNPSNQKPPTIKGSLRTRKIAPLNLPKGNLGNSTLEDFPAASNSKTNLDIDTENTSPTPPTLLNLASDHPSHSESTTNLFQTSQSSHNTLDDSLAPPIPQRLKSQRRRSSAVDDLELEELK